MKSNWTSVKERLPELAKPVEWVGWVESAKVLAAFADGELRIAHLHKYDDGEPEWRGHDCIIYEGVTHWQPLPDAPKEGG